MIEFRLDGLKWSNSFWHLKDCLTLSMLLPEWLQLCSSDAMRNWLWLLSLQGASTVEGARSFIVSPWVEAVYGAVMWEMIQVYGGRQHGIIARRGARWREERNRTDNLGCSELQFSSPAECLSLRTSSITFAKGSCHKIFYVFTFMILFYLIFIYLFIFFGENLAKLVVAKQYLGFVWHKLCYLSEMYAFSTSFS